MARRTTSARGRVRSAARRMAEGDQLRDHAAHRDADHVRARVPARVEHAHRLVGHDLEAVVLHRLVGRAGAAVVEGDGGEARRERCQEAVVPVARAPAETHDEEHGRAGAAHVVGELDAAHAGGGARHARSPSE